MGCYLFNPRGRDHQKLFGADAFFDFDTTGAQAELYRRLAKGDTCVVLSYVPGTEDMLFRYFQLEDMSLMPDPERGVQVRVLRGQQRKEERMTKAEAAAGKHRDCFNKNGHLKQLSML